jgi:hypothetical protein
VLRGPTKGVKSEATQKITLRCNLQTLCLRCGFREKFVLTVVALAGRGMDTVQKNVRLEVQKSVSFFNFVYFESEYVA